MMVPVKITRRCPTMITITFLLFLLLGMSIHSFYSSGSSLEPNCNPLTLESTVISADNNLNKSQALNLAQSYLNSVPNLVLDKMNFSSISNGWTVNPVTCSPTWKTVDVHFTTIFTNDTGGNVVVSENPGLDQVKGLQLQPGVVFASTAEWSGWQFQANNNGINDIGGYWQIPSVSKPSTTTNCYNGVSDNCILANWVGLSSGAGLTGTYGQGGSMETVTCNSGCTSSYNLWYQWQGGSVQNCDPASAGDLIDADQSYSSPLTQIQLFIYDQTNSDICQPTESASVAPYYGQITMEIPQVGCCNHAYLPEFSGTFYFYNGEVNSYRIDNSLSVCSCDKEPMNLNNSNPNINLSSISYASNYLGYFTEQWITSLGT